MLEYPPPPCPVDDTPYTGCVGAAGHYHVDADGRIHPGLGGVIVIRQTPMRDECLAAEAAAAAGAGLSAPPLVGPPAPEAPPAPVRRTRRAR